MTQKTHNVVTTQHTYICNICDATISFNSGEKAPEVLDTWAKVVGYDKHICNICLEKVWRMVERKGNVCDIKYMKGYEI